jgi:hypothetical protein
LTCRPATVGLQAFEALLAIVKGSGAFADVQHVIFGQGAFVPLAIAKVRQIALVGLDVVKTQLVPIDAFVTHDTLYHLTTAETVQGF